MKKLTTDEFISKSHKIHKNKYKYDHTIYENSRTSVIITCPIHGNFEQKANTHLKGCGCPKCKSENFGNRSKMSQPEFIEKASKFHNNKYDYSKVVYTESQKHVVIICPIHGEFKQTPNAHLKQGCCKCGIESRSSKQTMTTEEFIKRANIIHGHYKYNKTCYLSSHSNVIITCPEHGDFKQKPYSHLQGHNCPKCTPIVSKSEIEIQDYIKTLTAITTNNRTIISPKELDIYIPSKKLAIEFNGTYWHSELKGKTRNYHLSKTLECNKKGIRLLHINEDEWINKAAIVKARLKNILGLTKYKLYGRKCEIREISSKSKSKFLNKYHIQGDDKSSIKLGAFYKNRLVAVMTFGKNRYGKDENCYELIRYATISSFNCIGVAGKLLKYFERNYECSKIKTYADLRWSEGNLYKQLGFTHKHNSTPNYFYFNTTYPKMLMSRVQFQKHKLKDKLKIFDPNLSEWENMKANGYDRIWDCGNMVFEQCYPIVNP